MQVYATHELTRLARRLRIGDEKLCDAADRAARGLISADLRAGLIKQRIARSGQGKSGGWRVLAAFRFRHGCVFLYAFPKNERDNIDDDELAFWHKVANAYLAMSAARIEDQIENDELRRAMCDDWTRDKRYRTQRLEVLNKTAEALHRVGQFDKATMREFDAACLTPVEDLSAQDIQAMRERAGVSQAVFASYLNVKPKLVSEWERGEKKPSGPSLKLLAIVKARGLSAIA